MTAIAGEGARWRDDPVHKAWLAEQADSLFRFFQPHSIDPKGGFAALDDFGAPMPGERERQLHSTTRMVHCFSIAKLMGRAGADDLIDHGMNALKNHHRDAKNGGYFWSFDADGPRVRDKLAYGHGFVLLAASSAKTAGHPGADALMADIVDVLNRRFWEAKHGASAEEFREDWTSFDDYRGQNANMHLTEALMAAYEATGERDFLAKATSIAELILHRNAAAAEWRVPEHYHSDWTVDKTYSGNVMFRPYGYTPGHALEWSRLVMQLHALTQGAVDWAPAAAANLFRQAVRQGWDGKNGGLYYTLEYDGAPRVRDRLWWPICEGMAAAYVIARHDDDPFFEEWYRRIVTFADAHLIDYANGGWRPALGDDLQPMQGIFVGKGDIYHALQACLIPLHPATHGIVAAVAAGV